MANSAIRAQQPPGRCSFFTGRNELLWIALGLIVANLAVYWRLTGYQFLNFDDDWYVVNNTSVSGGFTWAGVRWALTSLDYFYWQPLTWLSHMLDCQLFGLNAGSHHLTNLLIHVINTLLVFALFRRMTGRTWRSGMVAALFSLHPLAVESVAWIAERKNLLSGLFCLLTMWAYVHYVEQPSTKRYRWVLLAFIGGLMAKPMLLTLPFALLALDYWPLQRPEWSSRQGIVRLAGEKLPLLMLGAISSLVTYIGVRRMGALDFLAGVSVPTRIANALYSYIRYLELTVLAQRAEHPLPVRSRAAAVERPGFRHCARRVDDGRDSRPENQAVPARRMGVVRRDITANDRPGAGRPPRDRRPVYVHPLGRLVRGIGLARGGRAGEPPENGIRAGGAGAGRVRVRCMDASRLLAGQRHHLPADRRRHA